MIQTSDISNLYVHFPFCRTKCSYCALYSRTGVSESDRAAYVRRLAGELGAACRTLRAKLKTIYFGGGSPALCDLGVLASVLRPLRDEGTEFTVELHPLDVTGAKLDELKSLGVNRISMGVQSLDDATLAAMGRGYAIDEAERAFARVKRRFDNAGIDLIVGYPGEDKPRPGVATERSEMADGLCESWREKFLALSRWGLRHCSLYSLQNERGLTGVPDDDWTLDRLRQSAECLRTMGLERYEISNYAVPGFECRHNQAVWRGEDYLGLGEGACGRIGLKRISNLKSQISETEVTPEEDFKERTIFRLRTREGLDVSLLSLGPSAVSGASAVSGTYVPSLVAALDGHVRTGLLTKAGTVYRLTERGTEVCDSILADLV